MGGFTKSGKVKYAKGNAPGTKRTKYAQMMFNRRRGYRRPRSVSDWASLSENGIVQTLPTNTMVQKNDYTLAGSPRASGVATAYQHYRIKKITLIFRPNYDTYAPGGTTVPHLYYMFNKSGSIPTTITIAALKSMGAKLVRLDDKTIKISWRPSVLTQTVDTNVPGNEAFSQYRISPWLSTNANALNPGVFQPSGVDHLGIFFYVENIGAQNNYTVETCIEYQFKKPLNTTIQEPNGTPAMILGQ